MKRNAFWNLIDKAGQRTFLFLPVVNVILGLLLGAAYSEMNVVRIAVAGIEKTYREELAMPPQLEQTGIETYLIKQVSFEETHFKIEADPSRYEEIMEVFIPFLREKTNGDDARFVLEFDHDSESRGLTVCIIQGEKFHPRFHDMEAWRTPAFWNNPAK